MKLRRLIRLWHDCNLPATDKHRGWECDGCGARWSKPDDVQLAAGAPPTWERMTGAVRWIRPRGY